MSVMIEMTTYTVTLHASGAITYGEPRDIEWKDYCDDCGQLEWLCICKPEGGDE